MEGICLKKFILFFSLLFIFTMIISAQSQNNEQRLVGTWINVENNSRIIFNANGSVTGTIKLGQFDEKTPQNYVATIDKIYFTGFEGIIVEYSISNDGRILIIYYSHMGVLLGNAYRRI